MVSAGRVMPLPKGAYNSATTYNVLDIVTYNDSSYIAKQTTTGNVPTNTTYWQLLVSGGAVSIDDLDGVSIVLPTNGQILQYNSTTGDWENEDVPVIGDLSDLGDVVITSATNGQVLKYNSTSGKWENGEVESGHTIVDPSGTDVTDRSKLQFGEGFTVSDDSVNDKTVVNAQPLTSNRNLLINPWFTVNQRGVTSGSVGTSATYLMDLWAGMRLGSYSLSSNGFSFAWDGVNSTFGYLKQSIDTQDYNGKTVTFSAYIDETLKTYTFTMPNGGDLHEYLTNDIEFIADTQTVNPLTTTILLRNYSTTSHTIRAVKLELGSTSTLAYDVAPNYTTELLKCQRYFVRLTGQEANWLLAIGNTRAGNQINCMLQLPTSLRATPTVTVSGNYAAQSGASNLTITDVRYNWCRADCLRLVATVNPSTATAGDISILMIAEQTGYVDISAEL